MGLDISEWFSAETKDVFKQINDSFRIVYQPKKYITSLAGETNGALAKRLIVLAIAISLLEICLLMPLDKLSNVPFAVFKVGFFESGYSILLVPIFALVLFIFKIRHPIKIAIGYIITMRFTLTLPVIISYYLFLHFEDYLFAYIRGISVYLFLLSLVAILPIAMVHGFFKKSIAIFLLMTGIGIQGSLIAKYFSDENPDGSLFIETSFFYDPIGEEFDSNFVSGQGGKRFEFPDTMFLACNIKHNIVSQNGKKTIVFDPIEIASLKDKWLKEKDRFLQMYSINMEQIQKDISNCNYLTNKRIFELESSELFQLYKVALTIDDFESNMNPDLYIKFQEDYLKMQKIRSYRQDLIIRIFEKRLPLVKLGFIVTKRSADPTL